MHKPKFPKTLPTIPNKTWFKVVRRHNTPLMNSFVRYGSTLENNEVGFDSRMHTHVILYDDVYDLQEEFDHLINEMVPKLKQDINFLQKYYDKVEQDSKALVDWAKKNKNFSKDNLLPLFKEYVNKVLYQMTYIWSPLGPEEFLQKEIELLLSKYIDPTKDFEEFNRALDLLKFTEKKSKVQIRKEKLLVAKTEKDLIEINENFCSILDHPLSRNYETLDQLKQELKNIKDPKAELKKIQEDYQNNIKNKSILIKKYKFNTKLLQYSKYASELALVRFDRLDCLYEASYALKDFLDTIESKINLPLSLCFYWEILDFLDNKPIDKNIIKERANGYADIYINNTFYELNREEGEKIRQIVEPKIAQTNSFKGQTACLGKVTAKVKILHNAKEINKIKQGEILVTSMTTPEYIPAMEKASAFLTDEGGISCHAAIVAREMKKPCIIGTKHATKLLKDNDLIELDADNGIVTIKHQNP